MISQKSIRSRFRFSDFLCKVFIHISLLTIPAIANAQVTIQILSLPEETTDELFIAGNFNGWNPADENYRLYKQDGRYSLTFTPENIELLKFKITRGSWEKVECDASGNNIEDRVFYYKPDLVEKITIAAWIDKTERKEIPLNEDVIYSALYSSQLQKEKQLRILLPEDYYTTDNKYPVVYMMDAQNLFDDASSFSGEWGIDETMTAIYQDSFQTSIIVGIDHAGEKRLDEYNPYVHPEYGGGEGEAFADFLTETLKPFIDSAYRSMPQRENTYIAGSSLGGMMSFYVALKDNDVFGNAFIFSPSFWIAPPLFAMADTTKFVGETYLYFVVGGNEGKEMVEPMYSMHNILMENNDPFGHYRFVIEADALHNETFWRKEFPRAYLWLISKE